jgi:hypothetical protein
MESEAGNKQLEAGNISIGHERLLKIAAPPILASRRQDTRPIGTNLLNLALIGCA